MNVLAASFAMLCSLAASLVSADALAADGTIFFTGEIVLSTADPGIHTVAIPDGIAPQHTSAEQSLPLDAEFELLDYYADYMDESGIARAQLTLQTAAYE
ncbi:MAG TPA: hypothetical protein VIT90_00850 [Lysobacter sp.]